MPEPCQLDDHRLADFWKGCRLNILVVLIYDIETSQFDEGKTDVPIDIVGYSDFDIVFESEKNLEDEEFSFDILDCPSFNENIEVKQLISRNVDEEIDNLYQMCKIFMDYDIYILVFISKTWFDYSTKWNWITLLIMKNSNTQICFARTS